MAFKVNQLREESTARLREMLVETQENLVKHKMRVATGEGVNPHEAGEMRREVARIKTLLRAVELVAARAGVDQDAARAGLKGSGWHVKKAVAAAKVSPEPLRSG